MAAESHSRSAIEAACRSAGREENPDFLQPWSRAILMFCILCVGFVVARLWLALFPEE